MPKSTMNGKSQFMLQEISDLENMDENEEVTVKEMI
jgi:hypothetical protein